MKSIMKKNYITRLLFLLILPVFLLPAETLSRNVEYGFALGRNVSYLHGSYTNAEEDITVTMDSDFSWNYDASAYIRFNLSRVFSIQPEVNYITRSTSFNEDVIIRGQDMRVDGRLTMTHVELPILLRLSNRDPIPEPPRYTRPGYSFNIYSGASIAYNTRSRFSGDLSGNVFGVDFDEAFSSDVRDQFNETDINFIAGAGVEYGRHTRLTADIRYKISIMDIGSDPEFREDMRFSTLSLGLGVIF